ncbi:hypothetical protein Fmac_011889 [Flemingia macrophylla]|uniref:Uncharacterized protein n=1 Tax=Flemingia macrophylla TaxID=520843 RepID=A0ABD1MPJ2_9FABA
MVGSSSNGMRVDVKERTKGMKGRRNIVFCKHSIANFSGNSTSVKDSSISSASTFVYGYIDLISILQHRLNHAKTDLASYGYPCVRLTHMFPLQGSQTVPNGSVADMEVLMLGVNDPTEALFAFVEGKGGVEKEGFEGKVSGK